MRCPICRARAIERDHVICCTRCWQLCTGEERRVLRGMHLRGQDNSSKVEAVRRRRGLGAAQKTLAGEGRAGVTGGMDAKSTGITNKTSGAVDLRNAPPKEESPNISTSGNPGMGPAGFSITERAAPGVTGGAGSAKKLNSDDQMPSSAT